MLYLKNTVKNNYDSVSDESITVKKLSADISVTKTSNVYSILKSNDTEIKYQIVVTNSGTQPLTEVSVVDALSGFKGTAKINAASWSHSKTYLHGFLTKRTRCSLKIFLTEHTPLKKQQLPKVTQQ